jgi:L-lactate utilization protein LutC
MKKNASGGILFVLVACLTCGLLVVACGSTTDHVTTRSAEVAPTGQVAPASVHPARQSKPLSRRELIHLGDKICGRTNTEIAHTKPRSLSEAEIVRITPGHAVIEQKGAAELALLVPPRTMATTWKKIITYRRQLVVELWALVDAARNHEEAQIKVLEGSKRRKHNMLLETARTVGFDVCGYVG